MPVEERPELVCFLPTLAGGGAERVMLDLASSLISESSRRVTLVVASRQGSLANSVPENVPVVDLGHDRRTLGAIIPFGRYLRQVRPRTVLSTLEHANLATLLATRGMRGVRVVLREANTVSRDLNTSSMTGRALLQGMRLLYPRADAVIAVSGGVARDLKDVLKVPDSKIEVIRNPVLTDRVWNGAEEPLLHPWFAPAEPPVILGVGRLAPQKGFDTLLRAFSIVRSQQPCRLLILGEGELRPELAALAVSLGVEDDFQLAGYVENPFPYIARSKTFVLSSLWEGLPNVLIQAVALGTNVVATDCPSGPAEILDGGELGRLVPIGDAPAMAEAINGALQDADAKPTDEWLERYDVASVTRAYDAVLFPRSPAADG